MPGVGLVQEKGPGQFQLMLPFGEADVVVPMLLKAPRERRDGELVAARSAMKLSKLRKRADGVIADRT